MAVKAPFAKRRLHLRSELLESLEHRQLMAGFNANFNFQPAASPVPSGFTADIGKAFATHGKLQYGWNANNTTNTRDRGTHADARHDTLAHFSTGGATKWEVAVPNGTYKVAITAGDANFLNSHFGIAVEGHTIINGTPTSNSRWLDATGTVNVTDGRLTVTGTAGSFNNKINSIQITQTRATAPTATGSSITTPSAPTWTSAYSSSVTGAIVKWNDTSKNESGFIVEHSLNKKNWTEAGRVGPNVRTFNDSSLKNGTKYYYRIKAYNAAGTSTASPIENATTLKLTGSAPSSFRTATATASDATTATVGWNDVAFETGYKIGRSTDNRNFTQVGSVNANVTGFTDTALKASTKYYYRVQAYNAVGTSTSGVASTTTPKTTSSVIPLAASHFIAKLNGTNAATLTWSDVANETGYVIQKSTDGKTFIEAGRVGANLRTFTATGLKAKTTYTFRVLAFNTRGTSAASVTGRITTGGNGPTAPDPTPSPTPHPTPTPIGGGKNQTLSGINLNGAGNDANQFKATLNDVGIKNVRMWYNITWGSNSVNQWYAARAKSYKAAGFKVMLAVLNTKPTDYATAKRSYAVLANDRGLRDAVDYWQIGNEPNIPSFWSGTYSQYVNNDLKPGYEAFHAVGETVVGAGPSWDINVVRQLTSLGYTKYCDFAAFHPYADTAAEVIRRAAGAKIAYNNKPMIIDEWNVAAQHGSTSNWVHEINTAAAGLAHIGYLNYYFGLTTYTRFVGPSGIVHSNGTRNSPFYDAVKGWLN